jgi:hypothetical protein
LVVVAKLRELAINVILADAELREVLKRACLQCSSTDGQFRNQEADQSIDQAIPTAWARRRRHRPVCRSTAAAVAGRRLSSMTTVGALQ